MDHYTLADASETEVAFRPTTASATAALTTAPAALVTVGENGKIKNYVGAALKLLTASSTATVRIRGDGAAINKTVTVTEIVKRRLAADQLAFSQENELGWTAHSETYTPNKPRLDTLKATRNVPFLLVVLQRTAA
ncbi:hypothetical protein BC828DRAFT_377297 [Blastocladiella britannica]|nr:hypothetical protein BC828DRAFT_377297 [Blastocladiella britannica]